MGSTILITLAVFLTVTLLLVALLLFAKAKLSPSGLVKVTINGEKTLEVAAGGTLLSTLSEAKIFLPSACGGGGTCAMCKCQVLEGGGEILPTESPYFNRKEIQNNWRLGCQVKVKQDMEIKVPEEIFGIKKWECEVVSNYNVASFIKEFVVKLPEGEHLEFEAGGYIQIDVPPIEVDFKDMDITAHPDLVKLHGRDPQDFQAEWDKFNLWPLKMRNDELIFRAYS
ncbi:MAG: 2Fe-2S iron-sulfur cluster binding domain-containing protein, partial [Flavobacteriales bacterium]|nr:2Fe-2S iron-sulfur cluster binding domain-containing protein [Flavobacteriales bacterium]